MIDSPGGDVTGLALWLAVNMLRATQAIKVKANAVLGHDGEENRKCDTEKKS